MFPAFGRSRSLSVFPRHYRFKLDGRAYDGTTGLAATKQNARAAQDQESERRKALKEGYTGVHRILIRQFKDAATEFLEWAKVEYRAHPNSYLRVATSFASARQFFGVELVSAIDAGRIEAYKTERVQKHEVRDVTLRHDLNALSKFFGYAKKHHWTRENPFL